jgi:hypothetical protein
MPSYKIFTCIYLFPNSEVASQTKIRNWKLITKTVHIHPSPRTLHSVMATFTQKTKQYLKICRNIKTFLDLDQQMTLYLYTCLSRVLRSDKCPSTFILTLSLILRFQDGRTKWMKYSKKLNCVSLFYHQLDAQTSCLFTYNTLIKILHMLPAYPAHLQELYFVIIYMRSLLSSLSAGDCFVHQLNVAQNSHLQRVTIPETVYIQLRSGSP